MVDRSRKLPGADSEVELLTDQSGGDAEEHRFGETVKALRVQKGFSLRELGQRTGLSVGMLSQIERNVTSPSLKTLTKLRAGLQVPLSAFFGQPGGDSGHVLSSRVRRRAARPTLDIGDGMLKILLSPASATNLQLMILIVRPNGGSKDSVIGLPGEKAVSVMQGTLEMTVGDTTYSLQEGDTLQFDAESPHSFRNPGKTDTRLLWVIVQLPPRQHI